jgi:uncharacterized protein
MRYTIKDIGEAGIDVRVTVSEAWLRAECPDIPLCLSGAGVSFVGRLEPAGEGYLLRGTLAGKITIPCGRCLEPAPVEVESVLAVSFIERDEDSAEDDEAQDDVVCFEHGVVDIGVPIRDEILLAVPMTPICRTDCAGICPVCGGNRNVTPCDCEKPAPEKSKFGMLAKLKLQ